MHIPARLRAPLRKTARNASMFGLALVIGLLGMLVTSRWFPASTPVVIWWGYEVVGWLVVLVASVLTFDSVRAWLQPSLHRAIIRLEEHGSTDQIIADRANRLVLFVRNRAPQVRHPIPSELSSVRRAAGRRDVRLRLDREPARERAAVHRPASRPRGPGRCSSRLRRRSPELARCWPSAIVERRTPVSLAQLGVPSSSALSNKLACAA